MRSPSVVLGRARWLQRTATALAYLYPASLVATIAAFRFVGERWWVTAAALYLPRLVFLAPLPVVLGVLFALGLRRALWTVLATSIPPGLVLMGFVWPWPTRARRDAPSIRVLSYNVDSCEFGAENVAAVVDRYSPDVVLLQELGGCPKIVSLMKERYPTVRVDPEFLVATRFSITSTLDPGKMPYYGRLRLPRWEQQVMATPLGNIAFYNVHPLSPREGLMALRGQGLPKELSSGRLLTGANKDVLKANSGLRALQVANFAASAREETLPVVIAGDTNLPGLSFVLNRDLSRYRDGFVEASWGLGYTFPTTHRPWMRIDRMFASDSIRFVRFEVGHSHASDHDCIVADLQRAP